MFVTQSLRQVITRTRMNIVDNSKIGQEVKAANKKVKVIHIYNKSKHQMGGLGVKVLVTVLGQMKKGIVVGCVQTQEAFVPRFDSNNIVLMSDKNEPLGTRITAPLPSILRKQGATTARIMAIATKFV